MLASWKAITTIFSTEIFKISIKTENPNISLNNPKLANFGLFQQALQLINVIKTKNTTPFSIKLHSVPENFESYFSNFLENHEVTFVKELPSGNNLQNKNSTLNYTVFCKKWDAVSIGWFLACIFNFFYSLSTNPLEIYFEKEPPSSDIS